MQYNLDILANYDEKQDILLDQIVGRLSQTSGHPIDDMCFQ